jgi:hypothetical protein
VDEFEDVNRFDAKTIVLAWMKTFDGESNAKARAEKYLSTVEA